MKKEGVSFRTQFKDRMRQLRLSKGMTQEAFASFLGLSRPTIGFYERADQENGRVPDAETLKNICEKCEVSADFLLCTDDKKAVTETSTYTGLSEEAIEHLHMLSLAPMNDRLAILDYLLTLNDFDVLLAQIQRYLSLRAKKTVVSFKDSPEFAMCKTLLEEQGYIIAHASYEAKEYRNEHLIPMSRAVLQILESAQQGFVISGGPRKNRLATQIEEGEAHGSHTED